MLIHTCCADCCLHIIDNFEGQQPTLYFYNPNIHPRSEWLSRLDAVKKIAQQKNLVVKVGNYSPKEYFNQLNQLQNSNPEAIKNKKIRCPFCWTLRLEKAFQYASENGYKKLTSTLLSSQYQDTETIKRIGQNLAKKYEVEFIIPEKIDSCTNFKGFYKQNYCGCVYSLLERSEEKFYCHSGTNKIESDSKK